MIAGLNQIQTDELITTTMALFVGLAWSVYKLRGVLSRRAERGTPSPVRGGHPHARGTAAEPDTRRRPDLYDWADLSNRARALVADIDVERAAADDLLLNQTRYAMRQDGAL